MHLYEKRQRPSSRGILLSLAVFVLLLALFVSTVSRVESQTDGQQVKLLEDALQRAAVTCYAIEGRYPPTLEYIVENYSVIVDKEKYVVYYDAFASNVMPSITVLVKGASL